MGGISEHVGEWAGYCKRVRRWKRPILPVLVVEACVGYGWRHLVGEPAMQLAQPVGRHQARQVPS
jgi:hypothetical protein